MFNRAMSFLPSTRIRRRLAQQRSARKKKLTVGEVRRNEKVNTKIFSAQPPSLWNVAGMEDWGKAG